MRSFDWKLSVSYSKWVRNYSTKVEKIQFGLWKVSVVPTSYVIQKLKYIISFEKKDPLPT